MPIVNTIAPDMKSPPKRCGRKPKIEAEADLSKVIELIAEGYPLHDIAKIAGLPKSKINHWIAVNYKGIATAYLSAREARADRLAAQVIAIADEVDGSSMSAIAKAKLQCDARRWFAARLYPERYGDTPSIAINAGNAPLVVGIQAISAVAECKKALDNALGIKSIDGVQTEENATVSTS